MTGDRSKPVLVIHIDPPRHLVDAVDAEFAADPCAVLGHRPVWAATTRAGDVVLCDRCGARL